MKEFNDVYIEEAVRMLFKGIGEDADREGLKETPKRVAKMFNEVLEGMKYTNDEIAEKYDKCFTVDNDDMVVVKDIDVFSYCEHHIALMYDMKVSVAYIPNGKVIGLSKIARISEMVAKRLQIQERIGSDIAYILSKILDTQDIAVFIKGKHSCMTARGIKKTDSYTTTHTLKGRFGSNGELRTEVLKVLYS